MKGFLLHPYARDSSHVAPEQVKRVAGRLEGENGGLRSEEGRRDEGVVAVMGSDVNEHHAWRKGPEEDPSQFRLDEPASPELATDDLTSDHAKPLTGEEPHGDFLCPARPRRTSAVPP
jgi:hypothetical protein